MNWFGFELSAFLLVFVLLNVANVIIQTVKSIATIKCGAWAAAIINAVAYGLYTIVVVYMTADGLGLFWKALIIGIANLVGVYVVKIVEQKKRKDRLWKVECTIHEKWAYVLHFNLKSKNIPHNYIEGVGEYAIFNCYCATQKESIAVKELLDTYNAKYFVSESKTL